MRKNTNLIAIPEWHLQWCWENTELQAHWRKEWTDEYGGIHSHIYPGDRFSIGKSRDIGIVTNRIIWADRKNGGRSTHMYSIGGNLGGRWSSPLHDYMAEGHYLWIPTIEQLLVLRHTDQAAKLWSDLT